MKKIITNKKIILGIIISIYVISQLLGTILIRNLFLNYEKEKLIPVINYLAKQIESGKRDLPKNEDFILTAFDLKGKEIPIFETSMTNNDIIGIDPEKDLKSYLSTVFSGKQMTKIDKIGNRQYETIIIGYPLYKDHQINGAVFLFKPASEYNAILHGFYLVFFITLFLGIIIIILFLRNYYNEFLLLEKTKRNYIANISHELKTPISSIKALTETLLDNMVPDEESKTKYYSIIMQESNNLQNLVTDLLELSKIQSKQVDFLKSSIISSAIMNNIYETYSLITSNIGIDFEITKKAFHSTYLRTNPERLIQLFRILIDNAIKFTLIGGKITIDACEHKNHIQYTISDTGEGIPAEIFPHIFERFYKTDTAANVAGTGIGLSIAKEIIQGLNEQISVSSDSKTGTSFSFTVHKA